MKVRTFQARQMREALAIVRREMGADAMILTTRKLRRGLGLLGPAGIEITAAMGEAAPTPPPAATAVVSAATRRQDLRAILGRFVPVGPSRLVITKVDETLLLGGVLNAVAWSGLPLVYLTCGQRIPEDLEDADARVLGPRILQGGLN